MRFTLTIEFTRRDDPPPEREVDTGALVEHGNDLPDAGWRIGFQRREDNDQ